MADQRQQPVIFLTEGTKRTRGRDAQQVNIMIAKAVADAVKSTLGPKGMDKMIVDELGDITISNDGATILQEMSIEHPIGKMMVEIAKTQDAEVGDGTTTAVVLAGELLDKAGKLLEDSIHPTVVVKGYKMAATKCNEILDKISDKIDRTDRKELRQIALTTMTGKSAETEVNLADLCVDAVMQVVEEQGTAITIDKDHIKVEKKEGGLLKDSELIKGVVIDKEVVHSGMPKKVENAKIALVDAALEIKETETDAEISINDPSQLQAFIEKEESMLKDMVEKVKKSGATVLFTQKGIDDLAQHFLAKAGILAVRRIKKSDMDQLARATGASIITRLDDLSKEDLGYAKIVQEKKIANEAMVFVEGCKNPKAVTLFLRGGSEHIIDEIERAVNDAIGTISAAIKDGRIVTGGGSVEMELSVQLRDYAKKIGGREQLAIEAFADALEIFPRTLAETAGMDPIDSLVELRARHSDSKADSKYLGVNVFKSKITDMRKEQVIEPLKVKYQAINSASEVAEMILRIDDIIAGSSKGHMPQGMPPGMGGMGGMEGME